VGSLLQLLSPIGWIFQNLFYQPVYNFLMLVYHFTGGFALSVIIATLVLRAALIPLTRKQLKSQREMQVLQPKLKELQQRHRGNPQQLMEEQRKLYKEHGVSPLAGCLPLLIQLPVLYALYGSFYTVVPRTGAPSLKHINGDIYKFLPHLQHLPNVNFLWLNLGHPDPTHILPILAALLTFIQLRMALPVRKKQPGVQQDTMTQSMGMMQWLMPMMTLFIGLNFPAGLALYWCISTTFSVFQQYFINGRNYGSLFLNIPGLEHLVPPPKELPVATEATGRAGSGRARALPAASSVVSDQPGGGGLRGIWRQMREAAAAQQAALAETSARSANKAQIVEGSVVEDNSTSSSGTSETTRTARPERRVRQKSGAMLVKPAPSTREATSDGAETPANDTTTAAIRAATDTSVLPERAATRDGAHNGKVGGAKEAAAPGAQVKGASANGRSGPVPVRSANGAATARTGSGTGSTRMDNGQRKPSGKGPSGHGRSTRPKGGR
jgi:YidC/Oxa1 family membrane protein insertase